MEVHGLLLQPWTFRCLDSVRFLPDPGLLERYHWRTFAEGSLRWSTEAGGRWCGAPRWVKSRPTGGAAVEARGAVELGELDGKDSGTVERTLTLGV